MGEAAAKVVKAHQTKKEKIIQSYTFGLCYLSQQWPLPDFQHLRPLWLGSRDPQIPCPDNLILHGTLCFQEDQMKKKVFSKSDAGFHSKMIQGIQKYALN